MPSRRTLLRALGAGSIPLTGCGGQSRTPTRTTRTATPTASRTGTPTDTESPTDSPTDTPEETPRDVACETAWAVDQSWAVERLAYLYDPTRVAGHLLVGSSSGLLALDPVTGRAEWQQADAVGGIGGVADDVVLVNDGSQLTAVAAAGGDLLWTFEPPGKHPRIAEGVPAHDGTVYVGVSDVPSPEVRVENPYGRLYGFDLHSGAQQFRRNLTPDHREWVQPEAVVAGPAGVFVTLDEGSLFGLSHEGTVRWRRHRNDWYYRPVLAGETLLQPTSETLVALNAASGEVRWRDAGPEMHVTVADGVAYGAGGGGPDEDGVLVALDVDTGRHHWEATISGCGRLPAVGDGAVALPVGCRDRPARVTLFDVRQGCRYGHYQPDRDVFPEVTIDDGRVYTVGEAGGRSTVRSFGLP